MDTLLVLAFMLSTDPAPPWAGSPTLVWAIREVSDQYDLGLTEWEWTPAGLQQAWQELHDTPPSTDIFRLPDLDTIRARRDYWRKVQEYCAVSQELDWRHEEEWQQREQHARLIITVYDTMLLARAPPVWPSVDRKRLAQIRDQIGPVNYYAGRWP